MKDHTTIAVVLDNSGSMGSVLDDTIGGFNAFLKTQRETPGSADISLYKFGSDYKVVFENQDVATVKDITYSDYSADGGMTALYDAIGKTIRSVGARLANLPESERPNKVVLVVITDGHENSSREFKHEEIQSMIKHQEAVYSWETIYLGATPDAVQVATGLGFKGGSAAQYSSAKTSAVFSKMGGKMATYRGMSNSAREELTSGKSVMFTDEDRQDIG